MIFNMYSVWKKFDEKEQLAGLLDKLPKPATFSQNPSPSSSHSNYNLIN